MKPRLFSYSSNLKSIGVPLLIFILFDTELEASGGNPKLKTKAFQTIQTLMQELDLCDIWRIRNPLTKRYTWRGKGQGNIKIR